MDKLPAKLPRHSSALHLNAYRRTGQQALAERHTHGGENSSTGHGGPRGVVDVCQEEMANGQTTCSSLCLKSSNQPLCIKTQSTIHVATAAQHDDEVLLQVDQPFDFLFQELKTTREDGREDVPDRPGREGCLEFTIAAVGGQRLLDRCHDSRSRASSVRIVRALQLGSLAWQQDLAEGPARRETIRTRLSSGCRR